MDLLKTVREILNEPQATAHAMESFWVIFHRTGYRLAVVDLKNAKCALGDRDAVMIAIFRIEEGQALATRYRVPFWILTSFHDGDALYVYDSKHKIERREPGPEHSPREAKVISDSLFIPMKYFQRLPLPPKEEWVEEEWIEEEFKG